MKVEAKKKSVPVWRILIVLWLLSLGWVQSRHDAKIRQMEVTIEQLRQQGNQTSAALNAQMDQDYATEAELLPDEAEVPTRNP